MDKGCAQAGQDDAGRAAHLGGHVADNVTVEVEGHNDVVALRLGGDLRRGNVDNAVFRLDVGVQLGHVGEDPLEHAVRQLHNVRL